MTSIKIRNIRAIEKADIDLGGITVIAGENGCGKSTVSKLVYQTLFTANHFDEIVEREIQTYQAAVFQNIFNQTMDFFYAILPLLSDKSYPREIFSSGTDYRDAEEFFAKIRNFLKQNERLRDNEGYLIRLTRYLLAIRAAIPEDNQTEPANMPQSIGVEVLDIALDFFNRQDNNLERIRKNRPLDILFKRLNRAFEDRSGIDQNMFDLTEGGVSLFNPTAKRLGVPFDFRQVFYIDTPWLVDGDVGRLQRDLRVSHRFDLLSTMRNVRAVPRNGDLVQPIIGGFTGIEKNKSTRRFEFLRSDGKVFDLYHCATGIKSFSIIQMLFAAGLLGKETLLILDEPEAHLHPKWTFAYADLICRLNREYGVRFLISTHSPDMVQSLNAIAQHNDMLDAMLFYCAKPSKVVPGLFSYDPCENDISSIFESFNSILNLIAELEGNGPAQG